MEKLDAQTISSAIIGYLKECNLDLTNLRGQGYDGATVMSGHVNGACTRIKCIRPRALYHHCRAHSLNLVLSSSCKEVPNIRNLFDSVGKITWFLGASGKRKRILQRFLVTEDIASLLVNEDSEELSDDFIQNLVKRCVPSCVKLGGQPEL